jgi:hypothetical protein
MPYPRSKIAELLPAVLVTKEIAEELDKKAIRRGSIEKETEEHAAKIWQAVSGRIESIQLTEQAIASVHNSITIPTPPSYLERIRILWWTLMGAVIVGLLGLIGFGFWKGWSIVAQSLTSVLSWRNWTILTANILFVAFVLLTWLKRRQRFFDELLSETKSRLKAQVDPLQSQLQADLKLADESLTQALLSEVREILDSKKVRWFGQSLPDGDPDGLSQVENPEFEINTSALDRLKRVIRTVSGASIGISGPRGAGKSTLLWSNYQTGNSAPNVLSVFTSAPVEYDAREFVLHLFGSVCSRIIEKAVGRRESISASYRKPPFEPPFSAPLLGGLGGLMLPMMVGGSALLYLGLILAYFRAQANQAAVAAQNAKTTGSFIYEFLRATEISPNALIVWGFVLMLTGMFVRRYTNAFFRRRTQLTIEESQDSEYESLLANKGPLVLRAYHQLSDIRFQQSFTSGWSGALKLPVAIEGGMKSDRSWSERQRTLPDIVDEYRRFLDMVVGSTLTPYTQLLICIDELDKLESDEAAQRFLNGIKSVFNQKNCYYLVSISENAMSLFERRGLPLRDAFDSSFDEVIHLDYQTLESSKRLLSRRVLNLPHPYLCFCHILAGGLPRDLIRVCRALFDARNVGRHNNIANICSHVVFTDVRTKLRAMAVAAEKRADLPRDFINHLAGMSPNTRAALWELVGVLENDQGAAVRKDGRPLVTALPTEALLFAYFSVTVLEVFEEMDESRWLKGEDDGLFEELANVRRSLSRNPTLIAETIAGIRRFFGLQSRPQVGKYSVV